QNTLTVNSRDMPQGPLHDRDIVALGAGTTFRFHSNTSSLKSPSAASAQGYEQQSLPRQGNNPPPARPVQQVPPSRVTAAIPQQQPNSFSQSPSPFMPTIEAQRAAQGAAEPATQRAQADGFGDVGSTAPYGMP